MDDKWFKRQQKIAGKTADDIGRAMGKDRSIVSRIYVGRQTMTLDQAKVFAKVLDAPLEEVLLRAGLTTPEEAPRLAPGFADGDATPFTGKPQEKERATEKARLFGGNSPGIDVWTVQTNALILNGFIPGDQLVVDTHQSELCKAGDIVIAQKYDWQSGTAVTLLRRFEPPVLVSASPDPNEQRVQIVDGNNVVIKGKVIASWRASKS